MNLADIMIATVGRRRTAVALAAERAELSYHALDKGSARLASLLRARAVRPGDRVGLMVPNVPEFAIVYYAILRMGAVVVSIDHACSKSKIAHCLRDSGARWLFAWGSAAEPAEAAARDAGADCVFVTPGEFERVLAHLVPDHQVCDRDAHDPAAVMYPPGETASVLTHGEGISEAAATASAYGVSDRDVTLGALPLHQHRGQAFVLNVTMMAGGRVTLMPHFDADRVLSLMASEQVTFLPASREMYAALASRIDRSQAGCSWPRICVLDEAANGRSVAALAS